MRIAIVCLLVILAALASAQAFFGLFSSEESVKARDGVVSVDVSKLADGQARHYKYTEGSTFIRFFVLKDKQGIVRLAQDACEVCWREDKGYKLQEGYMLCVNCGMRFPLGRIGMARGGCNPHPLAFTLEGEKVNISAAELLSGAKYHPGNGI
jgi:uncharacterized membrane protein